MRFLYARDNPFSVVLGPSFPRSIRAAKLEDNLFDTSLAVSYAIKPIQHWHRMRKYKKFTSRCVI